ncbi:hypothetical protein ABPG75_002960 [Micractinium tetrahymenae]
MTSRDFGTLRGAARIQAEFKRLRRAVARGELLGVTSVDLLGDQLNVWRVRVSAFDADVEAGARLNRDLAALEAAHGADAAHVVLEVSFPPDYPAEPFFLRVVRPRMEPYSGHVTAGGSICIQALTTGPDDGCWRPALCVENVLALVLFNMLNAESVEVRTIMGGGQAGPLRIAMGPGVLQEYSEGEAKAAFDRTVANHRQNGWAGPAAPAAGAARRGGATPAAGRLPGGLAAGMAVASQQRAAAAVAAGAAAPALAGSAVVAAAAGTGAAPGAPKTRKRPAPVAAEVIDLLSDSEDEDGRKAAAAGSGKRPALRSRNLLTGSGSSLAGGSSSTGGHSRGPAAAVAAVAVAAGPTPGSARLGAASTLAVDCDLTGEDGDGAGSSQQVQPAQRKAQQRKPLPQRCRGGSSGGGSASAAHAGPAEPTSPAAPAEPALPAEPSLADRLEAANRRHGLDLRPPPPHWQVTDELLEGRLVLVELPLPGGPPPEHAQVDEGKVAQLLHNGLTRAQAVEALLANKGSISKSVLWLAARQGGAGAAGAATAGQHATAELRANGLSEEDAAAALAACSGRVDEALMYALETMPAGGPAAVARRSSRSAAVGPAAAAAQHIAAQQERERREAEQRAQLAAQRQREQAEAKEVLAAFERGGVPRGRVARIERVQQLDLWSQYQRRLARIANEAGRSNVNERSLFHGADKETLETICTEGFDHRVANLHGALGAGIYFADNSSYSEAYSRTQKHSAAAQPAAFPALFGAAAGPAILGGIYSGAQLVAGQAPAALRARGTRAVAQPVAAPPGQGGRSGHASPRFVSDGLAMLYCSVALGKQCAGQPGLRRPPAGTQSAAGGGIHAIFDNTQAYPTHIIHFK